jgi:hypothetical protein
MPSSSQHRSSASAHRSVSSGSNSASASTHFGSPRAPASACAACRSAATGRAFAHLGGFDVGIGLGVSRGAAFPMSSELFAEDPQPEPVFASATVWGSLELVVEVPLTRWSFARFTAGISDAVSPVCEMYQPDMPNTPCDRSAAHMLEDNDRFMPYAGVAAVVRLPEGPARQTFGLPR